jgi:hypothetical protein
MSLKKTYAREAEFCGVLLPKPPVFRKIFRLRSAFVFVLRLSEYLEGRTPK